MNRVEGDFLMSPRVKKGKLKMLMITEGLEARRAANDPTRLKREKYRALLLATAKGKALTEADLEIVDEHFAGVDPAEAQRRFDSDIELMIARCKANVQRKAGAIAKEELDNRLQTKIRLQEEFKKLQEEGNEKIRIASHEYTIVQQDIRLAAEAENFLLSTCTDTDLLEKNSSLRNRENKLAERLREQDQKVSSHKSIISNAASERRRLVANHAHPETIKMHDEQVEYAEKYLAEAIDTFNDLRAELDEVHRQQEEIRGLMLRP